VGTLSKQYQTILNLQIDVKCSSTWCGVNSKKPPQLRHKFEKPPIFFQIAKNRRIELIHSDIH
jgi:hypothetical protein